MESLIIKSDHHYHYICPEQGINEDQVDYLYTTIEKLLMVNRVHVVLDLKNVNTIFSLHLTLFVKLFKLLKSCKMNFALVGLSSEVVNVLEMTQLDDYLDLYIDVEEFKEHLKVTGDKLNAHQDLSFDYSLNKDGDTLKISFTGFITSNDKLEELKKHVQGENKLTIDLSNSGFIDTKALIWLSDLTQGKAICIRNPSNAIFQLLEENNLVEKFEICE